MTDQPGHPEHPERARTADPWDRDDPHRARVDLLEPDHAGFERPVRAATADEAALAEASAVAVLRRGLRATPELRVGLVFTLAAAVTTAAGKLAVPILI